MRIQKPKTVRELRQKLSACVTEADQEKIIKRMVADSLSPTFRIRHEARTLLLAYLYGEPSQRQHVSMVTAQEHHVSGQHLVGFQVTHK
jgi:hypothetical protein